VQIPARPRACSRTTSTASSTSPRSSTAPSCPRVRCKTTSSNTFRRPRSRTTCSTSSASRPRIGCSHSWTRGSGSVGCSPIRARLLDALWWRLHADATIEALLTLVLCDGWTLTEIAALVWRDVDLREGAAAVAGQPRRLLPHTASVLRRLQAGAPGASPWGGLDRAAILEKVRLGWESLTRLAQPTGRKSPLFPNWDHVRSRIDPPGETA
jgi:hypothetical protein